MTALDACPHERSSRMPVLQLLILAVLFHFLLHHHRLGNHFYAVGGNRNAAVAIGINPTRTKIIACAIKLHD